MFLTKIWKCKLGSLYYSCLLRSEHCKYYVNVIQEIEAIEETYDVKAAKEAEELAVIDKPSQTAEF